MGPYKFFKCHFFNFFTEILKRKFWLRSSTALNQHDVIMRMTCLCLQKEFGPFQYSYRDEQHHKAMMTLHFCQSSLFSLPTQRGAAHYQQQMYLSITEKLCSHFVHFTFVDDEDGRLNYVSLILMNIQNMGSLQYKVTFILVS